MSSSSHGLLDSTAIVERLRADNDVSLASVLRSVARALGKPIRIERVGDDQWESLTGLLVDTPQAARILVRATDPMIYQMHCILHEVGHLIHGHPSCHAVAQLSPVQEHAGRYTLVRGRLTEPFAPRAGDAEASDEEEAEATAHKLAQAILAPKSAAAERAFG